MLACLELSESEQSIPFCQELSCKDSARPESWHSSILRALLPLLALMLLLLLCFAAAFGVCAAAGTLLLTVQLLLCFAVAFLWAREGDEEDACDESDEEQVDLKQQKQQEWASMAEEGRGLYEKLLSYT